MRDRSSRVRDVLSRARRPAGVLAGKIGAPASPELQSIRALQDTARKALVREDEMLEALSAALDGWQERASPADLAQIEAMRKRWALVDAEPADD